MIQLRDIAGIPVPRVIAWSPHKTNPVRAEYILEEVARGQPLSDIWDDLGKRGSIERCHIIDQVVQIERKLARINFDHIGSIYFRKDYPCGRDLVALEGMSWDEIDEISPSRLKRFTLGPLVAMDYWQHRDYTIENIYVGGPCK